MLSYLRSPRNLGMTLPTCYKSTHDRCADRASAILATYPSHPPNTAITPEASMKQAEWAHRANGASFNRFQVQESAGHGYRPNGIVFFRVGIHAVNRAAAILNS